VALARPAVVLEAFAQNYRDTALTIRVRRAGLPAAVAAADLSTVDDGVQGPALSALPCAVLQAAVHGTSSRRPDVGT
jgi:hypothetical protein